MDYAPIVSSSPPSTTPSLQQTSFTFPTPPPSNSSSPQPLLSSSSPSASTYHGVTEAIGLNTPTETTFAPVSADLQDQMSAHPLLSEPGHPLQVEPIATENNEPGDQNSSAFVYSNMLSSNTALGVAHPLPNTFQPAPSLPCSLPTHGGPTSFAFPSVPPHMQSLSFPNVSPSSVHPALHLPNMSHQAKAPTLTASFPPCSFTHPPSSLSCPPFQTSSCLAVSSSFHQSANTLQQTAQHPQNLPNSSTSSSYPPVDAGAIPQFNHGAPYRPERVLQHPSLLSQLEQPLTSTLPSSTPPAALFPAFPSYPLRLCQEPRSSLSIAFRHLYRQHQHGPTHPQGSYLDVSTRAVY